MSCFSVKDVQCIVSLRSKNRMMLKTTNFLGTDDNNLIYFKEMFHLSL